MFRFSGLFLVLFGGQLTPAPELDVRGELARLESANGAERAAAERRLAAHLTPADRHVLEQALATAGPEVAGRLIEALAAEDRHLVLAADLSASTDERVASVGRRAVIESVMRWNPGANERGLRGTELQSAMSAWTGPRIEIDLMLAVAPLEDVLDLCARATPVRLGLTLDPTIDASARSQTQAVIAGSFASVLRELAVRHGLDVVGYGCAEDAADNSERWLVLVPTPTPAGRDVTDDMASRLADWSALVAGSAAIGARSAAARALAASGWPGGVDFLAQRFRANGDRAALDGLMLAARRGRVAPQLSESSAQTAMREELQRALAAGPSGDRRLVQVATALGATGVRNPRGEDLSAVALEGLARLSGRALHARLVELDGRGLASEAAAEALDAVLQRADVAQGTHMLALELRARCAAPFASVPRARAAVEWSAQRGRLRDLARALRDARSYPPEEWRDPAQLPADWNASMRAFVAEAWFARGELDRASRHVAHALEGSDAITRERLAESLRDCARAAPGASADAWFDLLVESAEADAGAAGRARAVRLVALALGPESEARAAEVLATIPTPAVAREDLLLLGALAAGPRGAEARQRLIDSISTTAAIDAVLAGLDRALYELRASIDPEPERAFEQAVRAVAREQPQGVRLRFSVGIWPVPPWRDPVRLAAWDRSVARY
ncbi:MAG: hypothetical protein JNL28_15740 [Planctomycetes bacterium]|nr:hypothetical protein [Planctomycetota bacterium]